MKDTLQAGATHTETIGIDKERTISFMGDDLRVYGTPSMTLDIEHTCRELLLAYHDEGEDSVGARIEVDHLGPTLMGQKVTIEAKVVEVALPRVVFEISVNDELDHVGQSKHIRFVVDKAKQAGRLEKKKARIAEAG